MTILPAVSVFISVCLSVGQFLCHAVRLIVCGKEKKTHSRTHIGAVTMTIEEQPPITATKTREMTMTTAATTKTTTTTTTTTTSTTTTMIFTTKT